MERLIIFVLLVAFIVALIAFRIGFSKFVSLLSKKEKAFEDQKDKWKKQLKEFTESNTKIEKELEKVIKSNAKIEKELQKLKTGEGVGDEEDVEEEPVGLDSSIVDHIELEIQPRIAFTMDIPDPHPKFHISVKKCNKQPEYDKRFNKVPEYEYLESISFDAGKQTFTSVIKELCELFDKPSYIIWKLKITLNTSGPVGGDSSSLLRGANGYDSFKEYFTVDWDMYK